MQVFDEYDDEVAAAEEAEEQGQKPDQAKVRGSGDEQGPPSR